MPGLYQLSYLVRPNLFKEILYYYYHMTQTHRPSWNTIRSQTLNLSVSFWLFQYKRLVSRWQIIKSNNSFVHYLFSLFVHIICSYYLFIIWWRIWRQKQVSIFVHQNTSQVMLLSPSIHMQSNWSVCIKTIWGEQRHIYWAGFEPKTPGLPPNYVCYATSTCTYQAWRSYNGCVIWALPISA